MVLVYQSFTNNDAEEIYIYKISKDDYTCKIATWNENGDEIISEKIVMKNRSLEYIKRRIQDRLNYTI